MKKILLFLMIVFLTVNVIAQAPDRFSYQAVVRNSGGQAMPNQLVNFRISVLQGSASGTPVYVETKQLTTSSGGLADFSVGSGSIVTGTMTGINWATNTHFLKVEMDIAGGSNFVLMGTSQLMSVPYALDAKKAEGLQIPFVVSNNNSNTLIDITNTGSGFAIKGDNTNATGNTRGVQGTASSTDGTGVFGIATATSGLAIGVAGLTSSSSGSGVSAVNNSPTGSGSGIAAASYSPNGVAGYFTNPAAGGHALITDQGDVKIGNLSGTGTRMVVAGANGTLSTQPTPGSQWTTDGNDISNTNTGMVGIGTNTPTAKEEIKFNSTITTPQLKLSETGVDNYSRVTLSNANSVNAWTIAGLNTTTPTNDRLNFYHNTAGDVMQLSGEGKVGINMGNNNLNYQSGSLNVNAGANFNGVAVSGSNGGNGITTYGYGDAGKGAASVAFGRYGIGVWAIADSTDAYGLYGRANKASSIAIKGESTNGTAANLYTQSGTALQVDVAGTGKAIIVSNGKSGFGEPNPQEKLDVNGAIKIGNTTTNNAGTIKYDGSDLQGYVGGQWKSLTQGAGSSQWTQTGNNIINNNGGGKVGINIDNTTLSSNAAAFTVLPGNNHSGMIVKGSTQNNARGIDVNVNATNSVGIDCSASGIGATAIIGIGDNIGVEGIGTTGGLFISNNSTALKAIVPTTSGFVSGAKGLVVTGANSAIGDANPFPNTELTIRAEQTNHTGAYIIGNGTGAALLTTGRVGINTLTPWTDAVLDVNGDMYIRGGNPGNGKVLTSNADGKTSWQTPTGGVGYTAGTGINISGSNVISATAPTYTAGTGIDITGSTISSNLTAGTGINISGNTVSTNLNAGSGISISGNTISATGSATGGWNKTGNNISLQTSTDYVGIGTAGNAGAKLRIAGGSDAGISVSASGSFNNAIFANVVGTDAICANLMAASGAKGLSVSSTDATAAQFFSQNAASINVNPSSSTSKIAIVVPFDNSGFGTTTPTDRVHIVGNTSLRYEDGNQAAGKVLTSDANGRASWQTPTGGGGGGSSPWTVNGNDINNSNTGNVLVAAATGTTGARFEVANNPGGGFGKVAAISTTSNYMTALDVTESSTSGNPAASVGSTGAAAIRASAAFGDALFAYSSNSRGMFLKGGTSTYPAMKIENNATAITSLEMDGQIKINGGTPGAGKVLTSDANGLATWQTPSGGGGGSSTGWGLTGNSGNSATTNFIGNTDAVDLVMKTNNVDGLRLTSGGAILANGNTTTGTTPTLGAGTRMMWIPNRAAFRAGVVNGTQWNDINIGSNSAAFGNNCMAAGFNGFAVGDGAAAGGNTAFAAGKSANASGANSVALGYSVSASQVGAFCFGDQDFSNTLSASAMNEMSMRFKGGYRLFTTSQSTGGSAIGVSLAAGGNSWAQISDVRRKENFVPVNGEDFLSKIAAFNLTSWNYKGQDAKSFRHYGPMAQDFYEAFGKDAFGTIGNDTTISSGDFDGINFVAIQALEKRTSDLAKANDKLLQENKALLESIDKIKAELSLQKEETDRKLVMIEKMLNNVIVEKEASAAVKK